MLFWNVILSFLKQEMVSISSSLESGQILGLLPSTEYSFQQWSFQTSFGSQLLCKKSDYPTAKRLWPSQMRRPEGWDATGKRELGREEGKRNSEGAPRSSRCQIWMKNHHRSGSRAPDIADATWLEMYPVKLSLNSWPTEIMSKWTLVVLSHNLLVSNS